MPPRKTTKRYRKTGFAYQTSKWTKRTPTSMAYSCNSPRFKFARDECQWRIGSYRNVYTQFTPGGTRTVFSPSAANKWTRYVNSGVRVYKFNPNQFSRYFGIRWAQNTPTATFRWMRKKYGPSIKDVARGKGNCWLVATTKNISGRPFNNYNWWK